MSNLLWTGFEPFGELEHNPSMAAARSAAAASNGRCNILPVTYRAVRTWHAEPPAPRDWLWIHLGVGRARDALCIETTAYNRVDPDQPDESGHIPHDRLVCRNRAPHALCTALNPNHFLQQFRHISTESPSLDTRLSDDPGRFVCNAMYFRSLLGNHGGHRLFIHLPHMPPVRAHTLGHTLADAIARSAVGSR